MAGKRGDAVRTEFYDPQIMGKLSYANNPTKNRVRMLERFYLQRLVEMYVSRTTWGGLPDDKNNGLSGRFIEMALLHRGLCVFFHEDEVYDDYLVMRASQLGEINIYDNPVNFVVQGGSGSLALNKTLSIDECVPIWANNMRIPDFPALQLWATRLAEIDTTTEIAFDNARQTKFIGVPMDLVLSAQNVLKQMREGVPAIFGTEELSQISKAIETVDLESHPTKILNLLISKGKVWNEIMTFMGINNSNEDKKERLVSDEVHINAEQVDVVKESFLSTRQYACDQINDMFGLNLTVQFNTSQYATIQESVNGLSANPAMNQRQPAEWNQ